jgi:hypothetical protein
VFGILVEKDVRDNCSENSIAQILKSLVVPTRIDSRLVVDGAMPKCLVIDVEVVGHKTENLLQITTEGFFTAKKETNLIG